MASIFVALPIMGGFYPQMVNSLLALMQENPGGHRFRFAIRYNESLISRCRNGMAASFLASDCEYLLSIDGDLEFPPDAVDRLVQHGKDFVAAPYIGKGMPPQWMVRFYPDVPPYLEGLQRVRYVSGGFSLVHRRVFEAVLDPELRYQGRDGRVEHGIYNPVLHREPGGAEAEYLSEDWAFCQRALDKGVEIFCDFGIRLVHWGMHGHAMAYMDGKLPSHPMMPLAHQLDGMEATNQKLAAIAAAAPETAYAEMLNNVMSGFQEVQQMLVKLATGGPASPGGEPDA